MARVALCGGDNEHADDVYYYFECFGCGMMHAMRVEGPDGRPKWGFNYDLENPTFTPSILARWSWNEQPQVCHSFVTNGMIQFLGDCTHYLAGETMRLLEVES